MNDNATIEFDPPRSIREAWKSYWLADPDGGEDLQLPIKSTRLEAAPDGTRISAVTIPRYIAEDRGLIEPVEKPVEDRMSRKDWYTLGLTMALLIRWDRSNLRDCIWEARELAKKLM